MFLFSFSCLTQSPLFTPDFPISLINARFYWHTSFAFHHRHQKLWNVGISFPATIISTHFQRDHYYHSPGLLTLFLKHSPITHTVHLFSSQKRSILDYSAFSPQRNVLHTDDTNLLINKLPKRYRFALHNEQEGCAHFFFFITKKKKKKERCVSGIQKKKLRGLPLKKRLEKHVQDLPRNLHRNWFPTFMHKPQQLEQYLLDAVSFFLILISWNSEL